MSEDSEYLANYRPNQLYTHPGRAGAYATIVGESETVLGEIAVTARSRIAVSAFYVQDKDDFGTFKITKLRYHKTHGWLEDGHIQVNHFQLAQIKEFLEIISNLDLSDAQKARLSLDNINVGALGALLSSSKGAELVRELAQTPELRQDIYALAAKRRALGTFETMMASKPGEAEWQAFFEANPWIFGHGLNYIFLDKASGTLPARTTGNSFDRRGKTVDALMRTRAEVSQFVLIEIKTSSTELLRSNAYRPGCWGVSNEVSNAATEQLTSCAQCVTALRFKAPRQLSLAHSGFAKDDERLRTPEKRSLVQMDGLALIVVPEPPRADELPQANLLAGLRFRQRCGLSSVN